MYSTGSEYLTPILVSDATSMLKKNISKNERPLTRKVQELNNQRVDTWKEKVLDKLSDENGRIPSGKVWEYWSTYDEGLEVLSYVTLQSEGAITEFPDEVVNFWKDAFENLEVEELYELGGASVMYGWTVIDLTIKSWMAKKKYDVLYSKSDDPLYWEKNKNEYSDISDGKQLPFWNDSILRDVSQKVGVILQNVVRPQGLSGMS